MDQRLIVVSPFEKVPSLMDSIVGLGKTFGGLTLSACGNDSIKFCSIVGAQEATANGPKSPVPPLGPTFDDMSTPNNFNIPKAPMSSMSKDPFAREESKLSYRLFWI